MQAGTHPEGVLAVGKSLKSLGSNPLSFFVFSKHKAELGTEIPRDKVCGVLVSAKVSCPPARDVP